MQYWCWRHHCHFMKSAYERYRFWLKAMSIPKALRGGLSTYRLLVDRSSNMFSSTLWEVLGLPTGIVLASFTPPSNDLLPPSARSNTLKDCSTTGDSWTSSKAFADFRRPKPFGSLGMYIVFGPKMDGPRSRVLARYMLNKIEI